MILQRPFYQRDTITVAKDLSWKNLVHESIEGIAAGRIVETERTEDQKTKAAHSSGGRRTARNEVMYGKKDTHTSIYLWTILLL